MEDTVLDFGSHENYTQKLFPCSSKEHQAPLLLSSCSKMQLPAEDITCIHVRQVGYHQFASCLVKGVKLEPPACRKTQLCAPHVIPNTCNCMRWTSFAPSSKIPHHSAHTVTARQGSYPQAEALKLTERRVSQGHGTEKPHCHHPHRTLSLSSAGWPCCISSDCCLDLLWSLFSISLMCGKGVSCRTIWKSW